MLVSSGEVAVPWHAGRDPAADEKAMAAAITMQMQSGMRRQAMKRLGLGAVPELQRCRWPEGHRHGPHCPTLPAGLRHSGTSRLQRPFPLLPKGTTTGGKPMRVTAAALASALLLAVSGQAIAGGTGSGSSGTSNSGTSNSTGPNDAGAGSTPGASGSGPTTGDKSRSGTSNSTGANDAGSGSSPGSKGTGTGSGTR